MLFVARRFDRSFWSLCLCATLTCFVAGDSILDLELLFKSSLPLWENVSGPSVPQLEGRICTYVEDQLSK